MFEMFLRSCNCCRDTKTQSRKWNTNPWGSQDRCHEFCRGGLKRGEPHHAHTEKWGMDFAQHLVHGCSLSLRVDANRKEGQPLEGLERCNWCLFEEQQCTPFCRAAFEVVNKVKSGPGEADGKTTVDFGLVLIPPPGFACCPVAA